MSVATQTPPSSPATDDGREPLLTVRDLRVRLYTPNATVYPVQGVSYSVKPGEALGIIGESGSGKTVTALAPLGLLPSGVTTDLSGSVRLGERELVGLADGDLDEVRGKEVGVIFQDPLTSLNPMRKIGHQISEVVRRSLGMGKRAARVRALELLSLVRLPDARARLEQYPHELSGGMNQRVMIAMALASEPKLLVADEPTTALDVTVQTQVLELIESLRQSLGMALVIITHDLGVVSGLADRVAVLYAGRIMELGPVRPVLKSPDNPYTRGLIASLPDRDAPRGSRFRGLPGAPPDLTKPLGHCPFEPRCPLSQSVCSEQQPPLERLDVKGDEHLSACFVHPLLDELGRSPTRV